MSDVAAYVGRFAPSPTGPLHFGSLLAAVASFLEARQQNGRWLIRIEDIDPPREQSGAAAVIIDTLERYGFEWDEPIVYQSASEPQHREAINTLLERRLAYPCGCSRRDLADRPRSTLGAIYPGTCRDGTAATDTAIRLCTDDDAMQFVDSLQGLQTHRLQSESGDFVILRRDRLIAYHLAVVIDDHLQGITDIVRGIDLLDSTFRQVYLQQLLGYHRPQYAHIPVAVHADGSKLSKLTGAAGLSCEAVNRTLVAALSLLAQAPPADLEKATLNDIWAWAHEYWRIDKLRGLRAISADPKTYG